MSYLRFAVFSIVADEPGAFALVQAGNLTYREEVINVDRDLRFVQICRGARRCAASASFVA